VNYASDAEAQKRLEVRATTGIASIFWSIGHGWTWLAPVQPLILHKIREMLSSIRDVDRIARRIEALAPKSDRVVYAWRNQGETEEEVLERHYLTSPADRFAGQTYIFSWLECESAMPALPQ